MQRLRAMIATLVLAATVWWPEPGVAAERVALVIGNDAYGEAGLPDLNNAGKDARDMAAKLTKLGFEVITRFNAGERAIGRAVAEFESRLTDAEAGLVFYAGHAIQAQGRNWLIPSDARIEVEGDLAYEGVDAAVFLQAMERAGAPVNIVILDACRDNPLPQRTRSLSRGLSVVQVPQGVRGVAMLYSAAPGQKAADGPPGGNGIFTGELLKALDRPGLTIEQVFKATARQVDRVTRGAQTPFINASLTGDFYFRPPGTAGKRNALAPDPAPPAGEGAELLFWETVKDSDAVEMFREYLRQYPEGRFAGLARLKLEALAPAKPAIDKALVREVQVLLKALGHDPGPADGIIGPATREALAAVRATHDLGEGGIDAALVARLRTLKQTAAKRAPPPPARAPAGAQAGALYGPSGLEQSAWSMRRRAHAKPTGQTLTVDAAGGAGFTTISAAIAAAEPGDAIHVAPGTYLESLKLTKEVYLQGTGDDVSDVIVTPPQGPCLTSSTAMGAVRNITFVLTHEEEHALCVLIVDGGLLFADNVVTGRGFALVAVRGAGSNPTIVGNRIHDGEGVGVLVLVGARGVYEGNDIAANGQAGFGVAVGGDPLVRGNHIHHTQWDGISLRADAKGRFEDNEINANLGNGVVAVARASLDLVNNRIHRNGASGVEATDVELAYLKDNLITSNGGAGVTLGGGEARLEGNRIARNARFGVVTGAAALVEFFSNKVSENKHGGVALSEQSIGRFSGDAIRNNELAGIFVKDQANAEIHGSWLEASAAGLMTIANATVTVRNSTLGRNEYGVVARDGSRVSIVGSDLRGNSRDPWHTQEDAKVMPSDNKV